MNRNFGWQRFLAILTLAAAPLFLQPPAIAAQADVDLIKSYIGSWRGRGVANTANGEETIVCRMEITSAGTTKVNFNGRCTVAGGNVSINGTMAYVQDKNRFEAVMTSSNSFQGVAVGRRRGQSLTFALRDKNPDTGEEFAIDADMALKNQAIDVAFRLVQTATGRSIAVNVPFEK